MRAFKSIPGNNGYGIAVAAGDRVVTLGIRQEDGQGESLTFESELEFRKFLMLLRAAGQKAWPETKPSDSERYIIREDDTAPKQFKWVVIDDNRDGKVVDASYSLPNLLYGGEFLDELSDRIVQASDESSRESGRVIIDVSIFEE